MPRDQPIKIQKLRWQVLKNDPIYIASIGITLSNGKQSPMFTGVKLKWLSEIKEMEISEQTKTIIALSYPDSCDTHNLEFRNKESHMIGFTNI